MARLKMPLEIHGNGRFLLRRRDFVPVYVQTHAAGKLKEKVEQSLAHLGPSCRVCPRLCKNVDRLRNQVGVCRVGRHARVASVFPHFGEEDVLRGWRGSGTIFFSWCNLRCVFCQNFDISQLAAGQELDAQDLARLMLRLQELGCHNINFVTPEHVVPQVVEALALAVPRGLCLPLVYNTSAFDSLESLQILDGLIDIYMPDFKLWDPGKSREYLGAVHYPEIARQAIQEMHRQVGDLRMDEEGVALRGLLVRHLVMPGQLDDTRNIVEWLAALSHDTFLNLMDQYRPAHLVKTNARYSAINRAVTFREMNQAYQLARQAGLWRFDERWRKGDLPGTGPLFWLST